MFSKAIHQTWFASLKLGRAVLIIGCLSASACGGGQHSPLVAEGTGGGSAGPDGNSGDANGSGESELRWFSTWGTANYTTFPHGPLSQDGFSANTSVFIGNESVDQSFRMMIHPTTGGDRVRFRFENTYGDRPLTLQNVSVALRAAPSGAATDAASAMPITFSGSSEVTIPDGELVVSDGVDFAYEFGDDLAISFFVPGNSGPISWHAEAFASQYISAPNSGDVTTDASGGNFASADRGWFFLSGMDSQVAAEGLNGESGEPFSIAAFGDSITDGAFSTPELNQRWPDYLAQRLQGMNLAAGVVNTGINSNSVTPARDTLTTGVPGIERFARDVISRAGLRSVFVLLGTNDITAGISAEDIFAGLLNLADQAHDAGLCIVVSTILPRNDPPQPFGWNVTEHAPVREALNQMILESTAFDAVTDAVATAMENPLVAEQPNNALFVEGLHPNSAGMQVLANAVPLQHLLPPPHGNCER